MEDIINRITEFESQLSPIIPDRIILPGAVRQYLYEQGYETEAQVMGLIKEIMAKDS